MTCPLATARTSRSCSSGGRRWRWIFHQGRRWRRNWRLRMHRPALPEALVVRPEAVDDAAPIAARGSRSRATSVAEPGHEIGQAGAKRHVGRIDADAAATSRCPLGRRPLRDTTMMGPRCSASASESQASTMLRPEPRIITVASGIEWRITIGTDAHRNPLAARGLGFVPHGQHGIATDQLVPLARTVSTPALLSLTVTASSDSTTRRPTRERPASPRTCSR